MNKSRNIKVGLALLALLASMIRSGFAQFSLVKLSNTNVFNVARSIVVTNNLAYIIGEFSGLHVLDVSDPTFPRVVGYTNLGAEASAQASSLALSGAYAYIACGGAGLRIFDISNPTNPIARGQIANRDPFTNATATAQAVAVSGNYAYLANGPDGLRVYDVSEADNPVYLAHARDDRIAQGVAVSGDYVYVAYDSMGLFVYNVSSQTNPVLVSQITSWDFQTNSGASGKDVALAGRYVYLANEWDGLRIYDAFDPTNVFNVGHPYHSISESADGVRVSGHFAYLADGFGVLRIYDVVNPTNPICVGALPTPTDGDPWATGIAVVGNYAYLLQNEDGLTIYLMVPQLKIDSDGTNAINVSWPIPPVDNYVLQHRSNLTADWMTVTNQPIVANNRKKVILDASGQVGFFRLKLQ